ncbi:MAG: hypothetical protein J0J10_11410 [Bosea sp.]|uniref:hypothetical protein n=1 Tax=Bosea sp. (in: a-proteobacteria) TaxID=1871050 RepID=UPI001AC4AD93|nr:hypothetical protein [Bosea sp. (in: a-proteobacteria)]MBN9469369.1 hypothetical protein [Bosea sp. (in: a-proteobacteria)]
MLVRLDRATLKRMKRDARVVFPGVCHAQALEAMARGLGASSFNELRDFGRNYGAILWDSDDSEADKFLRIRGASAQPGGLANLVKGHVIDHEAVPGFDVWIRASGARAGANCVK